MSSSITPELVFDIFNIKRDGSNIVDEEDEDVVIGNTDTKVSFEEKAKEVEESIAKVPSGISMDVVVAEVATPLTEKPKVVEEKKEKQPMSTKSDIEEAVKKSVPSKLFGDIFDEDKKEDVKSPEPVESPVKEVVQPVEVEKTEEKVEVLPPPNISVAQDTKAQQPSAPMSEVLKDVRNGHEWKLISPAPKYEKLYEEKRDLLSKHLLKGGEIPFSKFYEELNGASVDTNVPTWDTDAIGHRISEVQKWRDRVKFIQLRVNSQYFVWKRIIEILPGVLARIEYERGKNDGIVYEHLNDFTVYFGHLEGLYDSCSIVSKNLDGAYNSLSRQVAIQQPLQEVERFTNGVSRQANPQVQKWDSLTQVNKGGANTSPRPKDADSSAEPQGNAWGDV